MAAAAVALLLLLTPQRGLSAPNTASGGTPADTAWDQASSLWAGAQTDEKAGLSLYARSAVLMDADSGRILVEKDGQRVLPMASTTKIMTCIVALEQGGGEKNFSVSSYAAGMPQVKLGVSPGETYYGKDLLYSMMLESHNDSAVVLAEGVAGTVENFAAMMNQKAEEIGCQDTHFVTPNGLDAQGHYTTAADLARILRYCILKSPKREEFLQITQTRSYTFSDVTGKRVFSCQNHNTFLDMMEGALTGKTGFTGNAGYCYTGALKQGDRTLIVALLACGWPNNRTYKWSDTKALMEYGLKQYERRDVWEDVVLDPVLVLEGIPDSGDLTQKKTVDTRLDISAGEKSLPLLLRPEEKVEIRTEIQRTVHAPVKEQTQVGWVEYYLAGECFRRVPVVTAQGAEKLTFSWCLKRVAAVFLGG